MLTVEQRHSLGMHIEHDHNLPIFLLDNFHPYCITGVVNCPLRQANGPGNSKRGKTKCQVFGKSPNIVRATVHQFARLTFSPLRQPKSGLTLLSAYGENTYPPVIKVSAKLLEVLAASCSKLLGKQNLVVALLTRAIRAIGR